MSKRAFYLVVLILILAAVLFGCTENTSTDKSDEYEFINIAGTYTLREEIRNGNLLVYDMQYEFFLSGKIICRISGYDSSSGQLADTVSYGEYVCDKKSGDIAFQFTTATKPSLMHYYGKYVETGVARFYLTGANSDGELSGDIVTASYEAEGPGRVSGYYYQFVNKGSDASTVIATPGLGAKFVKWSDGVTTPTRTDTNLTENLSVKAIFVQETPVYTVKYIVNDEYGEIIGETTQTVLSGGSTERVTVECKYPYGINDDYGYTFVGWSDGVTSAQRSDSNVTKDMEITAIIKRVWTVEYYGIDDDLIEKQYVIDGEDSTPVTAESEYTKHYFVGWNDGVTTLTRQEKNVKSNIKVDAEYAPKLEIRYARDENIPYDYGKIQGDNYQYVIPGQDATPVTAVPASWPENMYEFDCWSDGVTTATRHDKNITEEFIVYAKFRMKLAEYTITYTAGKNGRIDGETTQTVKKWENAQSVTAVPDDGYEFAGWSDGVTTATRQDSNICESFTVTASFKKILPEYTLTYVADSHGRIDGEATQTVRQGENGQSVTAVPDDGYEFAGWSDGVTTATRQDTNICEEFTVTAIFKKILPKYTLTYTTNLHGRIDGEATQTVRQGENGQSVTAVPDDGYEFAGWSDGVTTATRQDTNICEEFTVTAIFKKILPKYTLTYTTNLHGRIDGEATQTVRQGENGQSVTAVPDDGYEFAGWSDGVTTATRQDTNICEGFTVIAIFKKILPENTEDFSGGAGIVGNPYKITTIEQLKNIEKFNTSAFILLNDIELPIAETGTSNFKPLFDDVNQFNGIFDGNGKTISNITMINEETFFTGVFAYVGSDGVVKNLKLSNMNVSGTNYIGGLCGYNLGTITNCEVSVNMTYIKSNDYKVYVGGIAGRAAGCIDNNISSGTITVENASNATYIGGLTGYFEGNSVTNASSSSVINAASSSTSSKSYVGGLIGSSYNSVTITECYATGDVTATGRASFYAGGLIGSSGYDVTMTECYATGDVTATGSNSNSYAGGLIGSSGYDMTMTECYATGDVTATDSVSSYAGGLIGSSSYGTMTECYATGYVTTTSSNSNSYAGGLIGSSSYGTMTDCYATGDVTATATDSSSYSYAGGLVGYCSNTAQIKNSFSLSDIKGGSKIGAIVGKAGSTSLTNVHWLVNEESEAEFAVGYDENLGIPTNTGTVKHTDVSDFYTLADTLNAGSEEAVWENKDDVSLPTLIKKERNNQNKGE